MLKTGEKLSEWAKKLAESHNSDIALVINHKTLSLDKDADKLGFSYYIPADDKAAYIGHTFIIDGIGYDLFPMSWERIGNMADVKDYNTTCLGDGEIIYSRSEKDRQRFLSLQNRLRANLQNPHYMYTRALTWFDTANEIYQQLIFEDSICKIRENAGYLCDILSICTAFVNQRYFVHGQTNQIGELCSMDEIPENFTELYKQIVCEKNTDKQKILCGEMIKNTKTFLDNHNPDVRIDNNDADFANPPDFSELAMWYQELCYTWRRVYHWCGENDAVNAYIWCCMLQNECAEMGAKFGISDVDILSYFDCDNLDEFKKRAEAVEQNFISAIDKNGVQIETYSTVEEFLKKYISSK